MECLREREKKQRFGCYSQRGCWKHKNVGREGASVNSRKARLFLSAILYSIKMLKWNMYLLPFKGKDYEVHFLEHVRQEQTTLLLLFDIQMENNMSNRKKLGIN